MHRVKLIKKEQEHGAEKRENIKMAAKKYREKKSIKPIVVQLEALNPSVKKSRRRMYSPSALIRAYKAVKEDGMPVYRASRLFSVPLTTLRDRVDERVSIDCLKSGPDPLLSKEEEVVLVEHIKDLTEVGYGYTRTEVITMATDYAIQLGKRLSKKKRLSNQWYYNFIKRWPELGDVKPSSMSEVSEVQAHDASQESISNYFTELRNILVQHNLLDKPQCIYNIDEKCINRKCTTLNAAGSKTFTIIGAWNALGNQVPPYFVFSGPRMAPKLLQGKSAGANGTMTPTGLLNSLVFSNYMKDHFLKYVHGWNASDKLLVFYDEHRRNISVDLVNWAKDRNIIFFALPPPCSDILQPLDVGCFGPFQRQYNQERLSFANKNHRTFTRYDMCALACKAYTSALSPNHLQSAFAKAGIFPFKSMEGIMNKKQTEIVPSTLCGQTNSDEIAVCMQVEEMSTLHTNSDEIAVCMQVEEMSTLPPKANDFVKQKGDKVANKIEVNKSSVISGKDVIEEGTLKDNENLH